MAKHIVGFVLHDRVNTASQVQELLTKYGCEINTRLGLHVACQDTCSKDGLILLEFCDSTEESTVNQFEKELKEIAKVDIQRMVF
jgi:hypothetical protein